MEGIASGIITKRNVEGQYDTKSIFLNVLCTSLTELQLNFGFAKDEFRPK